MLFFFPGNLLILFLIEEFPGAAGFFGLNSESFSGVSSFFLSLIAWVAVFAICRIGKDAVMLPHNKKKRVKWIRSFWNEREETNWENKDEESHWITEEYEILGVSANENENDHEVPHRAFPEEIVQPDHVKRMPPELGQLRLFD